MPSPRPLNAVVYVRLSSHRGESDPSTSPARQREACEAYALAKGWQVREVVEDLDVSGSDKGLRLDRPGLRRVRELLPEVDVVLFAKLDRLARNVIDFRAFAEEADGYGAALVSVAESLDLTTPSGRFVATILAAFGEMEAATIAERTVAGKRGAVNLRRHANGAPPYGYQTVPHPSGAGRALAVEPDEAAHVRAAADHVLAGGSLYGATRLLNERGSVPRRAKAWSLSSVRAVLTSPALLGHVRHLGDVLRGEDGMPEAVWEPLITDAEALALAEALAPRSEGLRRTKASRLLSGLVRCSSCGGRLRVNSNKGIARYFCAGKSDGRLCERGSSARADTLDAFVEGSFLDALGWMPVTETRLVDSGAAEVAAVERAIAEATDAMREPDADLGLLVTRLSALRERRAALAADGPRVSVETVRTGETFADAWHSRDLAGQRALLSSALEGVVLGPGTPGRHVLDTDRVEMLWRIRDDAEGLVL
ncbi:recombinase family protein [Terrabacter sp. BE26]|uniref:recombinase family protein n=1 Tax=Terrabacter sp. BE26 TaxID=2898152 RepID=UPI0035BEA252